MNVSYWCICVPLIFLGYQGQLNPNGWYSFGRKLLGQLHFKTEEVQPFDLPSLLLPKLDFREVLVYIAISSSKQRDDDGDDDDDDDDNDDDDDSSLKGFYRVHTQDAYGVYEHFVDVAHSKGQQQQSSQVWLPLTKEKRVYATFEGTALNRKSHGMLYVYAYR